MLNLKIDMGTYCLDATFYRCRRFTLDVVTQSRTTTLRRYCYLSTLSKYFSSWT